MFTRHQERFDYFLYPGATRGPPPSRGAGGSADGEREKHARIFSEKQLRTIDTLTFFLIPYEVVSHLVD